MTSSNSGVPSRFLTDLANVPAEHRSYFEGRNRAVTKAWTRTDGKLTYVHAGCYLLRVDDNLYDINYNGERDGSDQWDVSDEATQEVYECYSTLREAVLFTRGKTL